MGTEKTKDSKNIDNDDSKYWKWGVFYFNREDERLFLSKKNPNMGITVNFAHPGAKYGVVFFIIIVLIPILGLFLGRN